MQPIALSFSTFSRGILAPLHERQYLEPSAKGAGLGGFHRLARENCV